MKTHASLKEGLGLAIELEKLLNEEFDVLRTQDISRFETLQPAKAEILDSLAKFTSSEKLIDSRVDDPLWVELTDLMATCRELHQRNEVLINRKLDATKGALNALAGSDPASNVEVYDRLGKISRGKKRARGYEDV